MVKSMLLLVGWLWPFIVAMAGVAAISAGHSLRSDREFFLMSIAALFGSPAIAITLAGLAPTSWKAEVRYSLSVCLAIPILLAELFLALYLFIFGANAAGPGWIE
jgi:hypothetical protein